MDYSTTINDINQSLHMLKANHRRMQTTINEINEGIEQALSKLIVLDNFCTSVLKEAENFYLTQNHEARHIIQDQEFIQGVVDLLLLKQTTVS